MRLLFLCLAVLPAAFAAVVNERCAWGESYWCSGLEKAMTCGAFQHCMSSVWKNQKLPADPSDVCQYCEVLIDDVHKFINDNKTEQDIANFFSTACNIIPKKLVADECSQLVKTYIPQLLNMITSGVTPQVICSTVHLCTGVADSVKHSEVNESPSGLTHAPVQTTAVRSNTEPICTDCKKFFGDIKNLITNQSIETELENMINQEICSLLGTYQQECIDAVKYAVPMAMQYLQQFFDPDQICVDFQFCLTSSSKRLKNSFNSIEFASPDSCLVCKTVMSEVQAYLRDESFQTMVKNLIKNDVCAQLGTLKTECVKNVDQYAPLLFELVASFVDPSTRCRSLGFCSADDLLVAARGATIGAEEAKIPKVVRQPKTVAATAPSAECIICEFIMREVDTILGDNKTEAAIINALDKVCSILPKTVAESCKSFVDTYGQAIISILQTEVTPEQVCTLLGLCKKSRATSTSPALSFSNKAGDAETCLICETLVQYVEAMIEQNATIVEVEAVVEKVCNFLPDTMKIQCDNVVDKYGPLIIQYITTKYDPKEVCTLINVCTTVSSVRMVNLVPAMSMPGSKQCTHGPSYWCASQENAEKCGAVEHCKTYVWTN